MKLGELLLYAGKISKEQLNEALEEQKKNEAKLAKERQKAEEERLQLLAALHREEEERQRLHATTIFNLHHIAKMSAAEIALIVNMEPETIEAIIVNHSGE